ncbi:MAG: class I SAM-dependent methyltransferase [Thermoanaerobaculia bacterium]
MTEPAENPLPPHPTLDGYYGEASRRERFVRDIFDETAEWYDWIIGFLSFGSGNWYRTEALRRAGFGPGKTLLDVATGTGVVARAAAGISDQPKKIIGLDPSIGMLREARRKSDSHLVKGRGETLPFPDASFDLITMGFALRHVADLRALFAEFRRVLKPGGKVLIMEITAPRSRVGSAFLGLYLGRIVPSIARVRSGSAAAGKLMHYYWDTIRSCVPPETIVEALQAAGFAKVERKVELRLFSEYVAE